MDPSCSLYGYPCKGSRELKERLERLNVDVSDVVRELLERYVEEHALEKGLRRLRLRLAGRIGPETIARLARG